MALERDDKLSEKLSQAVNLKPSLCDKCRFIFEQSIPLEDTTDIQHHENGKSMLEAAKYCHVCFAITYRMGDLWEAAKLPLKWTVRIHPNNQKSLDSASSTFTAPFAYGITVDFSPDDMIQGSGNLFAMRSQRG